MAGKKSFGDHEDISLSTAAKCSEPGIRVGDLCPQMLRLWDDGFLGGFCTKIGDKQQKMCCSLTAEQLDIDMRL